MKKIWKPILALLLIAILGACGGKKTKISLLPLALLGNSNTERNSTETGSDVTNSAPSGFSYTTNSGTSSTTITVGEAFSISPNVTGVITNCTISPALPEGLVLNSNTCAISGTPVSAFPQTTFTVTVSNANGSTTSTITLTGSADPPSNLTIPGGNTQTFTTGVNGTIVPLFSGSIKNCTINPSLPAGLVLNPNTCAISGTPTNVSPQQNYTITASNSFGSTNLVINFGVNTLAPQNLSFPFGASTSVNTNTTINATPSVTGGITSCSVNPSLPAGLTLNNSTCAITGTPTVGTTNTSYTVTATNQYGSTTAIFSLATPLVAPTAFSFPYTAGVTTVYSIGTPVNVSPAITGVVSNCTSSPSLPAGLTLNTSNCSITGTPTTASGATNYTITATNASGSVNTVIKLQVNDVPPSNLTYPFGSSTIFAVGTAISITPTITGSVSSCSPSPALPTGLSINASTCTISGTPTAARVATNYTITASNAYGSTNVIVNITAQLFAPSNLTFPFVGGTVNYTTGVAVNVTPTISGIVSSCLSSPSLPAGLSLNNTTCRISGTPTGTSPATNYTITATNASGSTNVVVTMGVNPPAPSNLVYPASGVLSFAIGVAKTVTPTKTGTIVSCVSNPSLPAGLTLNNTTCAISGTATVEQNATAYVITASNAGGSTTANITISVAQPPLNLSYPSLNAIGYANNIAMSISPSVTGNSITYSINPALPTGISLNTSTGVISGTYSANEGSTSAYIITATNSGGSTTTNVTLTFFGRLPFKTGQTQCYDTSGNVISCAGTGQDGEYQSGQPHSVYSGPNQHPTYTDDYTTTDTTNGLVWQSCPTGLSGADCTIGSFNNSYANDCAYLNSLNGGVGYSGRNDWRTPDIQEIDRFGILYNVKPSMQSNFPNQGSMIYVGDYVNQYTYPLVVFFSQTTAHKQSGACGATRKPYYAGYCPLNVALKCVSGTKNHKEPNTIDQSNNLVADINNSIIWKKCAEGVSGSDCQTGNPTMMTWSAAINYCKNLNYQGRTWKLPNINEAMTIYLSIDELFLNYAFPWDSSYNESMWTSTTIEGDSTKAFKVEFPGRDKKLKTETNRVRCISVAQ
ncbi:MAG: putative Ig domain-containing protein [Leptospiraceae bacterium]|nr:putative Ig domain-containing protein [Leptospiraceae bacterium]